MTLGKATLLAAVVVILGGCAEPQKTTLEGEPVDVQSIPNDHMRVFGIEIPSEYETTDKLDVLLYDSMNSGIGFKTKRVLPEALDLTLTTSDGTRETGELHLRQSMDVELKEGEKIYSCTFSVHAQYPEGKWNYSVSEKTRTILEGTLKVRSNFLTLSDKENPSLFERVGSYRVKTGDKLYLYYKCEDMAENQIVLYYFDSTAPDTSQKGSPLVPVLAARPPGENGRVKTTLTIGNDLKEGEYKFGLGRTQQTIALLDAWMGYGP